MKPYKVFVFDSRNTGNYHEQDLDVRGARSIARLASCIGAKKAQVEGEYGFFETYEEGKMTEWSVAGHNTNGL